MPSIKVRQLKPKKVDEDRANDMYYVKQRLLASSFSLLSYYYHHLYHHHHHHHYDCRYIKPDDVSMDNAVDKKVSASHKPILLNYSTYEDSSIINDNIDDDDTSRYTLDGFRLLEASTMSLPEDVKHITITDKRLRYVVEEDLAFFVNLVYLDASGNTTTITTNSTNYYYYYNPHYYHHY